MHKAIYLLTIAMLLSAIIYMLPSSFDAEHKNTDALILNHKLNLE